MKETSRMIDGPWGYACVEPDAVYIPVVMATREYPLRRVLAELFAATGHTRMIFSAVLNPDDLRSRLRNVVREWDEYVPELESDSHCIEIHYEPLAGNTPSTEVSSTPAASPALKDVPETREEKDHSAGLAAVQPIPDVAGCVPASGNRELDRWWEQFDRAEGWKAQYQAERAKLDAAISGIRLHLASLPANLREVERGLEKGMFGPFVPLGVKTPDGSGQRWANAAMALVTVAHAIQLAEAINAVVGCVEGSTQEPASGLPSGAKETSSSNSAPPSPERPHVGSGYSAACNLCGRAWRDGQEVGSGGWVLIAPRPCGESWRGPAWLFSTQFGVRFGEIGQFADGTFFGTVYGLNGCAVRDWGTTHYLDQPIPEPPSEAK